MRWWETNLGRSLVESGRAAPRSRAAVFDGAQHSRLTSSWTGTSGSIDADVYASLDTIRRRTRSLSYNNPYVRKFLGMCQTHVIGPQGFALQVRAMFPDGLELDEVGNSAVEAAFARWCRRGVCDVSGKLSFWDVCRLAVRAVARDGECLIRKVRGGGINPFEFGLMVVDIDRLDVQKNEIARNGNLVKMGVEVNDLGRPVAYWLRKSHPGDTFLSMAARTMDWERVPAEEVYHLGVPDRPEQTRFLPWIVAAMLRLQMLGQYEEAANVAANYGASKAAVITAPDGDASPLADDVEEGLGGDLLQEVTPGETRVLPPGYTMSAFDPSYPHEQFGTFVKAMLRGVASGVGESGISYNSLASDLEGVNYSSIRQGVLEERDAWMILQTWFAEWFLQPVYSDWLSMALLTGQVRTPRGGVIGPDKFDKFNVSKWQGRRWAWVDPKADIEAAARAIQEGLKSRRQVIAEIGGDIEDVWQDLAREQAKAKELGLVLGPPPAAAPRPAPAEPTDDTEKQP